MRDSIRKLNILSEIGRIVSYSIDTRRNEVVVVAAGGGGRSVVLKPADLPDYLESLTFRASRVDEDLLLELIVLAGGIPQWRIEDRRPSISEVQIESGETFDRFLERAYFHIRPFRAEDRDLADLLASGKSLNVFRSKVSNRTTLRIYDTINSFTPRQEQEGAFIDAAHIFSLHGKPVERMSYNECMVEILNAGMKVDFDERPFVMVGEKRVEMSPNDFLVDFVRTVVSKIRQMEEEIE